MRIQSITDMAAEEFEFDVFLSHSFRDKERARSIAESLKGEGLTVWFDEWTVSLGEDIYLAIERGLQVSRTLVLCISDHALNSDWVALERSTALFRDPTNSERRFIPVMLTDCKLPDALRRYKHLDLRKEAPAITSQLVAACRPGHQSGTKRHGKRSAELERLIEAAKEAARRREDDKALTLWEDARTAAVGERNRPEEILARLEIAFLELKTGGDVEEMLQSLNDCLVEAETVDIGDERGRLLQLLGEAHRNKGNYDQARGILNKALPEARQRQDHLDEGSALLALSAVERECTKEKVSPRVLELIQQAYNSFTAGFTDGSAKKRRAAQEGYVMCHTWRADVFGHHRPDDAFSEYARAIEALNAVGQDNLWNLADTIHHRGQLHARLGDMKLAAGDYIDAAERFGQLEAHIKQAKCWLNYAELLDQSSHRDKALEYYQLSARIALRQTNSKLAGWVLFRYSHKLMEVRDFHQAALVLQTLLQAPWLKDGQRMDVLKSLCLVAKVSGDEENLKNLSKALVVIIDDQISKATSAQRRRRLIQAKGKSLAELEEYEQAETCYRKGIEAFTVMGDNEGVIECWSSIAEIKRDLKKPAEERKAYETIIRLNGEDGKSFYLPMALVMLAQLDIKEEKFDNARNLLDEAERRNTQPINHMVLMVAQDLRGKLPSAQGSE